jgi:hypothetical protein
VEQVVIPAAAEQEVAAAALVAAVGEVAVAAPAGAAAQMVTPAVAAAQEGVVVIPAAAEQEVAAAALDAASAAVAPVAAVPSSPSHVRPGALARQPTRPQAARPESIRSPKLTRWSQRAPAVLCSASHHFVVSVRTGVHGENAGKKCPNCGTHEREFLPPFWTLQPDWLLASILLKQNDVGYSCDDKSIFAMWAQTERGIRLQFRSAFDQPSPNATLTIVQSSGRPIFFSCRVLEPDPPR